PTAAISMRSTSGWNAHCNRFAEQNGYVAVSLRETIAIRLESLNGDALYLGLLARIYPRPRILLQQLRVKRFTSQQFAQLSLVSRSTQLCMKLAVDTQGNLYENVAPYFLGIGDFGAVRLRKGN